MLEFAVREYQMRIILSQLRYPQTRKPISYRVRQVATASALVSIGSVAAWAAQVESAPAPGVPALIAPGYGPGIAGQVVEGPVTPVCRPNVSCTKPFADASVLILDGTDRETVGEAVTNIGGSFVVSVPPGAYVVHVRTDGSFPRCPEVQATVGQLDFTLVQLSCDTGIR
jgi:hypothetical protein